MTDTRVAQVSLTDLMAGIHDREFCDWVAENGVFYLTDHGVSQDDHHRATELAMDFFQHSTAEQRRAVSTDVATIRRGYSGLEAESTAVVTNTGQYSDYSMSYSMGLSDNLFPSHAFESAWTEYFDRLYGVAQATARAVLESSGTYDGGDIDELLDCDPVLRLRYFPEVPEHRVAERQPLRMAPHYDLSLLTLIHQTPCVNGFVSLQAQLGDDMVSLPAVPGAMVVVCGAVATLLTQGVVPAPRHHVLAPGADMRVGSGRSSTVFFLRPRPSFTFAVPQARRYGFDVCLTADTATFGDWIGGNYTTMHTAPPARTSAIGSVSDQRRAQTSS